MKTVVTTTQTLGMMSNLAAFKLKAAAVNLIPVCSKSAELLSKVKIILSQWENSVCPDI